MFSKTKYKNKKYFCKSCLPCFSSEDVLTKDRANCLEINGAQAIKMPKSGSNVQFKNHHRQMPVPFVIYADFEAITEKVSSCQPKDFKSYTNKYQKHTACSYAYKLVCCYNDKYSKPVQI